MKTKMNLYKLLIALLCCVILAGLLITALTDRNKALTAGWRHSGTCEWKIDDGVLTIRPLGDGSEGTLADWGTGKSPWTNNSNITSVVVKSGVKAATCHRMFAECAALTSLDLSGFDTSQVTDMFGMFAGCKALTALDLSSFDTSQVTDMSYMFRGCTALNSLDLSSYDTSKVTDMGKMFYECRNLNLLDLSSFDTSKVTDMSGMFHRCRSLTLLDLSSFDTSSVTDMSGIFYRCEALTFLDLSSFDTGSVTYMDNMFYECRSLTFLDLSGFDTSKVTDMDEMFHRCIALTELTLGANFNFKGTSMLPDTGKWANGTLFLSASQLMEQYNGSTMAGTWVWKTGLNTGWRQSGTCEWKINDDVLTIRPLGDGSEGTLEDWGTTLSPWWWYNTDFTSVVVKSGVKVDTCYGMFSGCAALTSFDLSNLNTSQVTDMGWMFSGCAALTSFDLNSLDTSHVTDMNWMFSGCAALTSFDLSSFDTSQVTDMGGMFSSCVALTALDLSSLDTRNVTYMDTMFIGCDALASLDLSSFDTSKVTDMSGMFYGCRSLTFLDLSSFNTSKVTDMENMFEECVALKELTLGANFNFKSNSCLPDPSDIAPYTGKWTNGVLSLTADELMEQYNGSTMAGTWVWETEPHTGYVPAEDGS